MAAVAVIEFAFSPASAAGLEALAYVGTYTSGESRGIYAFRFDDDTGRLTLLGLAASTEDPSYLAWDIAGAHLYAVNELPATRGSDGFVSAFARTPYDYRLRLLGKASTGGMGPCHLVVTRGGKLFAANFGSGSLAGFLLRPDGMLGERSFFIQFQGSGPDPKRQEAPHAHCVVADPSGRFVLVCDLGTDRVMVYRIGDKDAFAAPADPAFFTVSGGSGPRHLAFSRDASRIYVIAELKSTVSVFSWDSAAGRASLLQTVSTLPSDWVGTSTAAEVRLTPDGRFLYASNRGHDSIAMFPVLPDGRLGTVHTEPCGGRTPRFFTFDPSGQFMLCACQNSDSIRVLHRDTSTGLLAGVGEPVPIGKPVCILFAP